MKKRSKTAWGSPSKSKSKCLLLAFKTTAAFEVRGLDGSASGQNEDVMSSHWSLPHRPQCWEMTRSRDRISTRTVRTAPPLRDHPLFPLTMSGFRGHIWRWDPEFECSLVHWPSLFSHSTWENLCHKQCSQGTAQRVPGSCGTQECSRGSQGEQTATRGNRAESCLSVDGPQRHSAKWKINQSPKTTDCMIAFMWNVQNRQICRDRKQMSACQQLEGVSSERGVSA